VRLRHEHGGNDMSHVRRFDHVGITVADLDAATQFFVALGLEIEGRTFVEGEFIDTVIGIPGSRTEIVMLRPADNGTGVELSSFARPNCVPGSQPLWPTRSACEASPSRFMTWTPPSTRRRPSATGWWAESASTRALGGWPTSEAPRGSSLRLPSPSADSPGDAPISCQALLCEQRTEQ
jgi:hypothetical protein